MGRSRLSERWFAWFYTSMRNKTEETYGPLREALLAGITGRVLEIGAGIGGNFCHYHGVDELIAIEPNPYMFHELERAANDVGFSITLAEGFAEEIPLPGNAVDAVVCTLVLCSVDDVEQAMREIRRVLRPGGKVYFLEHVAAPNRTWLRRIQNIVRPTWGCLGDGCQTNRETWRAIDAAGFAEVDIEHRRLSNALPIITPHIIGYAVN